MRSGHPGRQRKVRLGGGLGFLKRAGGCSGSSQRQVRAGVPQLTPIKGSLLVRVILAGTGFLLCTESGSYFITLRHLLMQNIRTLWCSRGLEPQPPTPLPSPRMAVTSENLQVHTGPLLIPGQWPLTSDRGCLQVGLCACLGWFLQSARMCPYHISWADMSPYISLSILVLTFSNLRQWPRVWLSPLQSLTKFVTSWSYFPVKIFHLHFNHVSPQSSVG